MLFSTSRGHFAHDAVIFLFHGLTPERHILARSAV